MDYTKEYYNQNEAYAATKALFAEVYSLFLKRNVKMTLIPFDYHDDRSPQFSSVDDVDLGKGRYGVIRFNTIVSYSGQTKYYTEVVFDPYSLKQSVRAPQGRTGMRMHSMRRSSLTPENVYQFFMKYVNKIKEYEAHANRVAQHTEERTTFEKNLEMQALCLNEQGKKGRAKVYAVKEKDSLCIKLYGSPEDMSRALNLLNTEFPKPEKNP